MSKRAVDKMYSSFNLAIETPEGQFAPSSRHRRTQSPGCMVKSAREQKAINRERPNTRQQALHYMQIRVFSQEKLYGISKRCLTIF
jgi:hypothetical protein